MKATRACQAVCSNSLSLKVCSSIHYNGCTAENIHCAYVCTYVQEKSVFCDKYMQKLAIKSTDIQKGNFCSFIN